MGLSMYNVTNIYYYIIKQSQKKQPRSLLRAKNSNVNWMGKKNDVYCRF